MKSWRRRQAAMLKDWFRYSRLWQMLKLTRHWFGTWALNPERRLGRLISTYQVARNASVLRSLGRRIRSNSNRGADVAAGSMNWGHALSRQSQLLDRTIVVKAPQAHGEKGVLHVHGEFNWPRLAADRAAAAYLDKNYYLMLNAGWSPTDYKALFRLLAVFPGTLFIQAGNRLECAKLEGFHERIRCVPTLTSDWINPDWYRLVPRDQRTIDIVMVANWAPFKRHWELFRALVRLPADLQVALIGQPDGPHTVERVRQQAKDFGAPQEIRFLDKLKVEEVQDHLCQAKISLVLSKQEGACVVVAESLFADTPVGVLRDAHMGSKEYINPKTGVLLDQRGLAAQLADFLKNYQSFEPRQWAGAHIAAALSLAKLNRFFGEYSRSNGLPWTVDIVPFCWRPWPVYLHEADSVRCTKTYEELQVRFPRLFGAP
jgi:glycosyltransferase involved in cell wall biosynthesis